MTECSPSSTQTAVLTSPYVGRFAPSPSGPLHLGSLAAAVISWLHARQHQGQWLVRMEDLDPPREPEGTAEHILETLHNWGLNSDLPVLFQSQRLQAYQQALDTLLSKQQAYACNCSRKQVAAMGLVSPEGWRYNGHCRTHPADPNKQHCIRLDSRGDKLSFTDELQGLQEDNPEQRYGDFVLKRADGLFAYQLASVLDDAYQGVTHVVRGIDLLSSTSRQIRLQQSLGLPSVSYCHFPVLIAANGQKLSKQNLAPGIPAQYSAKTLCLVLRLIGLTVPNALQNANAATLLDWAIEHWQADGLQSKSEINCAT